MLSNIRTALTHGNMETYDYPVFEKSGQIIVSPVACTTGISDPELQAAQTAVFSCDNQVPPYGMSCFGVPFKTKYLWKVVNPVQLPEQLDQYNIEFKYYRLGLIVEMELSEARKIYDSIGHAPIWQKVPKEDIPPTKPEKHFLWDSGIRGPIATIAHRYISHLREKQEFFLAEGDENRSAEIDNFIMEIILTGMRYIHRETSISGATMLTSPPGNLLFPGAPQTRLFSTYASHPSPYQEPLFRRLIQLRIEELEKEVDLPNQTDQRIADIASIIVDLEYFLRRSTN